MFDSNYGTLLGTPVSTTPTDWCILQEFRWLLTCHRNCECHHHLNVKQKYPMKSNVSFFHCKTTLTTRVTIWRLLHAKVEETLPTVLTRCCNSLLHLIVTWVFQTLNNHDTNRIWRIVAANCYIILKECALETRSTSSCYYESSGIDPTLPIDICQVQGEENFITIKLYPAWDVASIQKARYTSQDLYCGHVSWGTHTTY